ncbi:MAG: hypothetical protein WC614_09285 [bacterium]
MGRNQRILQGIFVDLGEGDSKVGNCKDRYGDGEKTDSVRLAVVSKET